MAIRMAAVTANSLSFVNIANKQIHYSHRHIHSIRISLLSNVRASLHQSGSCCAFSNFSTLKRKLHLVALLSPPSAPSFSPTTRLFVSGLSFSTTEARLRNAFNVFGELIEVNLVMDNKANRPKGFAFLQYATEEESRKAIEGMHGKFLDGRVIFVEVARPRSELRKGLK